MRLWLVCLILSTAVSSRSAEADPRGGAGPPGGAVRTIAIDPHNSATLYAGTEAGLFKSTNAGSSWTELPLPVREPFVWTVAVDPANPSTIYALAGGLHRSDDAGATWTALAIEGPVRIVVNPQDTSTLYAGAFSGRGVFKSTDRGATWVPVNTGIPAFVPGPDQSGNIGDVTALAVDPANGSTVYAAFARGGIYKTVDAGRSWRPQNSGRPNTAVSALAADPANPSVLYAALYCGGPTAPGFRCDGGIFRTTDGGDTWKDVSSGLNSRDVVHLTFAPGDASVLYAGTSGGWVYRAADDGASWTALHDGAYPGLSMAGVPGFAVAPDDSSVLYVGTLGGGVYKSVDRGATWAKTSSGLTATRVTAVAIDPGNSSTLFAAAAGGGVFRTDDGGANWKSGYAGLTNTFISALAVHPGAVYAAAQGGGLFRSTDGGVTWTAASDGLPDETAVTLAVDPANPSVVFAGFLPYDR